ncbi:hypothetical protein GTP46_00345 [Duganella sp. FT135W]|uniref:NTF2 fold domain-containing protein n=1 Tax=Duganella flavida TaxID=2692175 RepID=A0A6L8K3H6_9BURK|nr:NTF2 fold immunity protein [Duganella flavida]MYM21097.1 hypothetical protein [Duganella flavida]
MRVMTLFFVLLFAVADFATAKDAQAGYRPPEGFVPDQQTAALIAEAVLVPIYGVETIQRQKPFRIDLRKGVWTVEGGTYPAPGGNFMIRISKKTGAILFVIHEK